jgi:hypothetical protein
MADIGKKVKEAPTKPLRTRYLATRRARAPKTQKAAWTRPRELSRTV